MHGLSGHHAAHSRVEGIEPAVGAKQGDVHGVLSLHQEIVTNESNGQAFYFERLVVLDDDGFEVWVFSV